MWQEGPSLEAPPRSSLPPAPSKTQGSQPRHRTLRRLHRTGVRQLLRRRAASHLYGKCPPPLSSRLKTSAIQTSGMIWSAHLTAVSREASVLALPRPVRKVRHRPPRPDRKNLRLPCRKDWLWLAKRALLSWPGRLSRARALKGKDALLTPLPRGEWRGRGGGGGCRHEPQRR